MKSEMENTKDPKSTYTGRKREVSSKVRDMLSEGTVIPALPLALDENRKLDEKHQRALLRYYMAAGAGGIAVAVHTTQFEIRLPGVNLHEKVLEIAAGEFENHETRTGQKKVRIAGVIGKTEQAVNEAHLALHYGYDAILLGLGAFSDATNSQLIKHCQRIARIIPVVGFYLQPAVGGRKLDANFWREFVTIENVIAVKIAPFNRYQTLDVVRALAESGRADEIALYTGNDDNILVDLLSEYEVLSGDQMVCKRFSGGLLGHWAVWTRKAVELLYQVKNGQFNRNTQQALRLANQITDSNAAFFDAANNFKGCITGIHEVLRRQGLLKGIWTLNHNEFLSPGQKEEINRVYRAYPHLNDDEFVAQNLPAWLD